MMLEINNLTFSYNKDKPILDNLSLALDKGELCFLLGANGKGKTTLFKNILGFLEPKSGSILIDGKDIKGYKAKELAKTVAYIPQKSNLTFPYTVLSTVVMGSFASLTTLSSPHKKEEEKAIEILKQLGLEELKDKPIDKLSGGEQQLVMIARALCQNAKLLLLDEITANLDYANQLKIYTVLRGLAEKGYTILLSTHNPEAALNHSTRLIALDNGNITFSGTPEEAMKMDILSKLYRLDLTVEKINLKDREHYILYEE